MSMQGNEEHIRVLLNKWYGHSATEAEEAELFGLLSESDLDRELPTLLKNKWQSGTPAAVLTNGEINALADRIIEKLPVEQSNRPAPVHRVYFLRRWGWAAAVLILLTSGVLYFGLLHNKKNEVVQKDPAQKNDIAPGGNIALLTLANGEQIRLDSTRGNILQQDKLTVINESGKLNYAGTGHANEYHTLSTPKGGQYRLTLPDGSKVWLNAASSIRYPVVFNEKERRVEITGEAYLEVAKKTDQPFVVSTRKTTVQVLGTHFNIHAYAEEDTIKTTLIEGKVKIAAGNNQAILHPGQQAAIAGSLQVKVKNNADIEKVIAWKNGFFHFHGEKLDEVMRQLSRWYNIEVVYEKGIPDVHLAGEMSRDLQLSEVMMALEETGVHFSIEEGRRLIIHP